MQDHSTAMQPRRDGLPLKLVLWLLFGLGMLVWAGWLIVQFVPATTQPAATQRAAPTPGAVGSVGYLGVGGDYGYRTLWVDELGLSAWNRAYDNRDDKGMLQIMGAFETLEVKKQTRVMVTNRTRDAVQVEMLDGEYAGRRGWTRPSSLAP